MRSWVSMAIATVVPEGGDASITELEFDEAGRLSKPTFSFVIQPDHPWPPSWVDAGTSAARLGAFKRKIDADSVHAGSRLLGVADAISVSALIKASAASHSGLAGAFAS